MPRGNNWLLGTKSLRISQSLSHSKLSQHIMVSEGLSRVHKSLSLVFIPNQMNPVHITPFDLRSILILSSVYVFLNGPINK
jgi:hypothetical protein